MNELEQTPANISRGPALSEPAAHEPSLLDVTPREAHQGGVAARAATPVAKAASANGLRGPALHEAAACEPSFFSITQERERERAGGLVMASRLLLRRGQTQAARDKLKEAFAIAPTDCGALELLGDIFMEEGEQEKALRVFERGLGFYPQHTAFEEKIAVAHLDLDEMRRDRDRRAAMIENPQASLGDRLLERKPGRALGISLLVPGAGQFYNGDEERAYVFAGAAIALFLCWAVPLSLTMSGMPDGQHNFGAAIGSWPIIGRLLFYAIFATWLGTHIYAAWDALRGAERANIGRNYGLGVEV